MLQSWPYQKASYGVQFSVKMHDVSLGEVRGDGNGSSTISERRSPIGSDPVCGGDQRAREKDEQN